MKYLGPSFLETSIRSQSPVGSGITCSLKVGSPGFGYIRIYRDITPIMENQMEKKMENEMETGFL